MSEAECVECGATVTIDTALEIGEILDCGTCGTELEAVETNPLVLERAPQLEEDWGE